MAAQPVGGTMPMPDKVPVRLIVNGTERLLEVAPWTTLLDALRDRLDLTGTKKGCDHGQCGACTVLVDGRRVVSCLTLAVMKDGAKVTTVEGLAADGALHPVQQAFIDHDAFQCGYCTPGQICSAVGLIAEGRANDARRDPRADERQHLPLRRLSQHRRGDRAGDGRKGRQRMINFAYSRAADVADAVRQIAADPAAKFIAGGTNLVDLMKYDVERPAAADRHHAPAAQERRGDRERRPAHRRARAEQRPRLPSADREALSAVVERDPGRRLGAIAQHGVDRRQSPAAHALLLFL